MTLMMIGRLGECALLAYRTPAASVRGLLPPGLELVRHGDWAFWNIVACRVEAMRPLGLPRWAGVTYHHVAYRLYVRGPNMDGVWRDGLFFVRSDADHPLLAWLGNRVSDFRFHRATISLQSDATQFELRANPTTDAAGAAELRAAVAGSAELNAGSCFSSSDEGAAFLKYRPLGLSCDRSGRWLKLAEVLRDEAQWAERPLRVLQARWGLFEALGQHEMHLELATRIAPIEYHWRLGRREPLPRRA
jgi:hypothetical protein